MAVVKNLMIRAGADFSAITKQANKASQSMRGMQRSVASSTNAMTAAFAGLRKILGVAGIAVSLGAAISAAKDAKNAYDEQASAEARLAQVMRNTMGASDAEIQSIKDLTSAQQALGVIGDEVQLAAAQELATYLTMPGSLKAVIPVMNDMVAQQYGLAATAEQATNVATMLGKVLEGQTGGLSRYGYYFDEAQEAILKYGTEAQRVATLAEVVEGSVGGMNAALAQTPSGQLQQVSNALGDIKEQFGGAVTTILGSFVPAIWRGINALSALATYANKVATAIANVFGGGAKKTTQAYGAAVGGVADSADDLGKKVGGAGKAAKEAKRTLAGFDELTLLTAPSDSSGGGGGSETSGGGGAGSGAGGGKPDTGDVEVPESLGVLERALTKVRDLVKSLDFQPLKDSFSWLSTAAGRLGGVISDGLGWAFDNILTPLAHWTIEDAVPAAINLLGSAFDFLAAVLEKLAPAAQWVWDNWLAPVAGWVGDSFISALETIRDTFEDLTALIRGDISFGEFIDQLTPLEGILLAVGIAFGVVSTAIGVFNVIAAVGTAIGTAFAAVIGFITSPVFLVVAAIAALIAIGVLLYKNWDTIKEKAGQVWNTVTQKISGFVDKIKQKFTEMKDWIGEKIDAVKAFFDFEWKIPHIPLPHFQAVGEWSLIPPTFPDYQISWYAKGGIVDCASLIGAGERGAEAIMPLENNTGWMDAIADRLSARIGQLQGGDTRPGFDVYLDGKRITEYLTIKQRQAARAGG